MVPTRTSIESYTVAHLVDASRHWNTSAQQWEAHFETVNQQANMVTFLGPAADGMRLRTGTDHVTAIALSEQLRTAAHTATMGASELEALHRATTTAIQAAEDNDFIVGEDLSVQDRTSAYLTPIEAAERQAQAKAHAASIGSAATALHTHDTAIAGTIEAHSAVLATTQFADGRAVGGQIQAVGHGFKTDSGAGQNPGPTPNQPTDLGGLLGAPPDNSFVDQYKKAITTAPAAPPTSPIPMPAGPPATPPQIGPQRPPVPAPQAPAEVNPSPGVLAGAVGGGCLTGGEGGGVLGAFFPPIEPFTTAGGCIGGGLIAGGAYLGGIWVDNMLNGNG